MRSLDDAPVFAHDLALSDNEEVIRIDPQADRTTGERRRHTVAIAFQMHETGGRDPLAVFHEAIERPARRHQTASFISPGISNRTGLGAMRDVLPHRTASLLKPEVQAVQTFRMRYRLPESMARILNVLLDLAFFPTGCRIAELGLEHVMADHRRKPRVDCPRLAAPDLVDRRARSPGNRSLDRLLCRLTVVDPARTKKARL